MWAELMESKRVVTVIAEDSESWREVVFLQPAHLQVSAFVTQVFASMLVPAALGVIDTQELVGGFSAAVTAGPVMSEYLFPQFTISSGAVIWLPMPSGAVLFISGLVGRTSA